MPKRIEHLNARPSNEDHKRQQCVGKQRFATKAEAQAMAKVGARRHSGGFRRLQPYPCRHCRGYHVGTSVPSRRAREALRNSRPETEEESYD